MNDVTNNKETTQSPVVRLHDLMESGAYDQIQSLMNVLKPPDIAHLLASSPSRQRTVIWNFFDEELQSEIISFVDEEIVPDLLGDKSAEEIVHVLEHVPADDDLAGGVEVGADQHLPLGGLAADGLGGGLVGADEGDHPAAAGLSSRLHEGAASCHQPQPLGKVEHACEVQRRVLAQREAGGRGHGHLAVGLDETSVGGH
ncbi:MAG: hypothetical protein IH888_04755 [Planctomycetes bacterium]|nr:hypothetical protein [Planctomycetota bacterium]